MLITTNEAIENLNTILNLLNDLKLACKATLAYVKQRCIGSKPLAELLPVREKVLNACAVYELLDMAAKQLKVEFYSHDNKNNVQAYQQILLFNFFAKYQLQTIANELLQVHGAKAFMSDHEIGVFWQRVHDELENLFKNDPRYYELFNEVQY